MNCISSGMRIGPGRHKLLKDARGLNITLDGDVRRWLAQEAKEQRVSLSHLVRKMINDKMKAAQDNG